MKAIVYKGKRTPDKLALKEVAKPEPADHEVLIKVQAATVTPSDVEGMGAMLVFKPFRRFSAQPEAIPGVEFSGIIEKAGYKVRQFREGDRVFGSAGTNYGAWAEYICLPDNGMLAKMPSGMSFDEAAGICDGALTALHFLINKAKIKRGQSVLINGASGSVGSYAVQLSRYLECRVTGVCGKNNADLVRSLGAERVIDYAKEDFTQSGQTYDIVFDTVAKSSFTKCKRILKPGGLYLTTVPSAGIFLSMLLTRLGGRKRALFAATGLAKRSVKVKALQLIGKLLHTGKLTAVCDKRYPFERITEAMVYVAGGHKKGSVIIAPE